MQSNSSIPKRPYGDTGIELSVVTFGGIVVKNAEQDQANRLVDECVERGVNYFDVSPVYGDAEFKLGPSLKSHRKDVFLACKTNKRNSETAEFEFNRSLERLQTDYFDLYQMHSLVDVEKDVDRAFMDDGIVPMLIEAKKDGRIRHIGLSAHSEEAALAAMDRFDFDSVLFPLNFACWMKNGFGKAILAKAQEKGVARLALKSMARQHWPDKNNKDPLYEKAWYEPLSDPKLASLAFRWTLSHPITAAIPPGPEPLFRLALDVAANFTPITEEETAVLNGIVEPLNVIFP